MSNNYSHSTPTSFPTELCKPGGIMEQVIDYINQTAKRKQPVFAVSAALAMLSVALGRKYKSYTGIFPNIYLINIGETGCGKDNPRKRVKEILAEADKFNHVGGDKVASASAIVSRLGEQPNTLYLLDEIGLWLQGISSSSSPQHLKEINATLLSMFTSSDSIFTGTDYADRKNRPNCKIELPSLSLLGTTTPGTFLESLSVKDAASGLLGRFLCFETYEIRPTLDIKSKNIKIPSAVVDWVVDAMGSPLNGSQDVDSVIEVPCTDKAQKILKDLIVKDEKVANSDASNTTKNLWVRAFELASKVSLILACSRNIKEPKVDVCDALYAVKLVSWCIEENCKRINENVSENETDKKIKRLEQCIRNVTKSTNKRYINYTSKGIATKSYLLNSMKLDKVVFEKILETVIDSERVKLSFYNNGNKSIEYYKLV